MVDVDGAGVSSLQVQVARSMVIANNWLEVTNPVSFRLCSLTRVIADRSSNNSGLNFRVKKYPTYETVFGVMFCCLTFLPFSFLTAVNIFNIIAAIEIIKSPGGQIVFKSRRDICKLPDDRCTMLAGG